MGNEMLKKESPLLRGDRLDETSLSTFDLPVLIEKIKNTHAWINGELSSSIILKLPEKQMVLAALHANTQIKSFQSNESITFQIIEGKLRFHTRKESVTLVQGQILSLNEKINYRLTTKEEVVFLLTILNSVLQPIEI
jgi:hypothetical protein